jgi:hypothetical protein
MRNASDDLTSDSVCGHFNSLDLKCFKSGYKKSHYNRFYRDTQRRDFRTLEDNSSLFDEFVCKLGLFGTRGPKKAQFTHERVEYKVFLFDEPLKG